MARGSMFVVLALSACMSVAMSPPPPPKYTSDGTVVWYPERHDGENFFSVTRLHGSTRLFVYVNPDFVYQKYTTESVVYGSEFLMEYSEHYEIICDLKPAQAAQMWGIRDSSRGDHFTKVEWYSVPQTSDGEQWTRLVIKSNGLDRYLLIITRHRLKKNANLRDEVDA